MPRRAEIENAQALVRQPGCPLYVDAGVIRPAMLQTRPHRRDSFSVDRPVIRVYEARYAAHILFTDLLIC
jgi:hypothetical protein